MLRPCLLAFLAAGLMVTNASAIMYFDEVDDMRRVNAGINAEQVEAPGKELGHPENLLELMKTIDGFRKEIPPPQTLSEQNGFSLKDVDGTSFLLSHLGGVAHRLGVRTKAECLVLLTYLKDRDPKIRFIAATAIENVVHAYPHGMSLNDILMIDSDRHREMIRRFVEKTEKLAA